MAIGRPILEFKLRNRSSRPCAIQTCLLELTKGEFYLLLPETGGTGAHTCRRRVMRQLSGATEPFAAGAPNIEITMGVASFPQDGLDLSQLLRIARHRADVSRHSPVRRLGLIG